MPLPVPLVSETSHPQPLNPAYLGEDGEAAAEVEDHHEDGEVVGIGGQHWRHHDKGRHSAANAIGDEPHDAPGQGGLHLCDAGMIQGSDPWLSRV